MDKAQRAFFNKIDEILWHDWNPVGFPVPKDEYRAYVPQIFRHVEDGYSEEALAKELHLMAMGINESARYNDSVKTARYIVEAKGKLL